MPEQESPLKKLTEALKGMFREVNEIPPDPDIAEEPFTHLPWYWRVYYAVFEAAKKRKINKEGRSVEVSKPRMAEPSPYYGDLWCTTSAQGF